jgi:excisionase family DNA binding protein
MFDDPRHDTEAATSRDALLRPSELMRMLGVSRSWLYQAAKDGRIPSVRLGGPDGPLRFHRHDVEQWLNQARAGWRPADSSTATLRRVATVRSRNHAQLPLIDP